MPDEFEKEYAEWKNTNIGKHPKNCICPVCEFVKEQVADIRNGISMNVTIKMCPDHYRVWNEQKDNLFKKLSFKNRIAIKVLMKLNIIKIREISTMQSDLCTLCRIRDGGRRVEVPPVR